VTLEEFIAKHANIGSDYWIRTFDTGETVEVLGLSRRTWERLDQLGDTPTKTQLSEGRVGYRVCHIAEWLDKRRVKETPEPTAA
jgi:predicted DNA-binding transcriptional regulator AlpA